MLPAANVIISPNMNLPVPIVSVDPGPDWANNINSCMGAIDSHDHTPGKGVPISSQAININGDLSLNNYSLTQAKSVSFSSQASFSGTQALYVENPDLFYNDGNGNIIRITQSGSVTGSSGTITGLPSGTASASYQSVGGTFQFQSATNTPANITGASLTVAPQTASPNGITIKSPSPLAASYNITLPTSLPSVTSFLTMSNSGSLATVQFHVPTVQKFLTSSGTYTLPSSPTPLYIIVTMCGGGGGGGPQTDGPTGGGAGVDTTFGTALLSAGGGFGAGRGTGAAGGSASLGSGPLGIAAAGSYGQSTGKTGGTGGVMAGGGGGTSPLGGSGKGGSTTTAASSALANSCSGGGGASTADASAKEGGGGGGAGAYVRAIINTPSSTYPYAVGDGGAGGSAAGDGGSGIILVEEDYQ